MKRRRWDSKTKTKIVLEGLSGRPISELRNAYGIHQNQYYNWRDKFLSEAHRAFESKKDGGEEFDMKPTHMLTCKIIGWMIRGEDK